MSREVDTSDLSELSNEEVVYLAARGQLSPRELEELGIDDGKLREVLSGNDLPLNERVNTGDVNTKNGGHTVDSLGAAQAQAQRAAEEEQDNPKKGFQEPNGGIVEVNEDDSYSSWSHDQLKDEIEARNARGADMAVSGSKSKLVERLEADDKNNDEEE